MANGVIKTLTSEKGFGFIKQEKGQDCFFHRSSLQNCKIEDLYIGAHVSFEIVQNDKGPRAEKVYLDAD